MATVPGMYGMLMPGQDQQDRQMNAGDSEPPPMSMAPPPAGEFTSREELLEFLKDWAESQGFAVVIGRSRPNRLWIKCDRGGEYADKHLNDPENRKRKRKATRLTGCPFNVKATMKKDKIWRCHTETPEHNHPPSEDLSVHPSLRRMTDEQLQKVNEMTEAGNTPVETLDELQRLWPGIKVLRRDIYNARKKYKTEKEVADMAQGLHLPQPFEDPNGKMPGPSRTGRWEWLEDGDEVKRKKRKKSSVATPSTPGNQLNLAPELRENASPQLPQPTSRRQASGLGNLPPRSFQPGGVQSGLLQQQTNMRPPTADPNDFTTAGNPIVVSPNQFRHYNPSASTPPVTRSGFRAPAGSAPPNSQVSPNDALGPQQTSRVRGAGLGGGGSGPGSGMAGLDNMPMAQMMSPMANGGTATASSGAGGGGLKQPSGQVLMSRIERMEREQTEQKAMLQQILGAVQGFGAIRR